MNALGEVTFGLAIVGDGVQGCGIARNVIGRGASIVLFEKNDLTNKPSSATSKLIHGGLRALKYNEFCLMREVPSASDVLWHCNKHVLVISLDQAGALDLFIDDAATSNAVWGSVNDSCS